MFGPASAAAGSTSLGASAAAGTNLYEGLHRLVHWGVTPAFDAFAESKNKKEGARRRADAGKGGDSKMGIPQAKQKLAELELSLLHREASLIQQTSTTS